MGDRPCNIYELQPVSIIRTLPQIKDHRLFQLKLEDGATWETFGHQPGQFLEVSIFGKGEAPISISSPPTRCDTPEICVRRTGRVTNALFDMGKGSTFNIRGPYGRGFPVESLEGHKLLLIDPREIQLAQFADLHLRQNIGTDVAVLNGMMNIIIAENLYDKTFVEERTEGFDDLKSVISHYTPRVVERISGIPASDLEKAARMYAQADKAMIVYCMGITQHTTGTDNVKCCANLAMLTGHVGRPSTGVNPLRGQNNVQGACDMGALPNVYSGYQPVTDGTVKKKFEDAWSVPNLDDKVGLTITEMIIAARKGETKALYIMGENPMMSDPDLSHVDHVPAQLEFLVVQDILLSETAAKADVVLPAASFAEKEGTFTNTERRVQLSKKAINPPGLARSDWQIVCEVSTRAGYPMEYRSPADVMQEINALTPSYAGITYRRLEKCHGIQWPCPNEEHPCKVYPHRDRFTKGRGTFLPCDFKPVAEVPDEQYDFLLTTGRIYYHYHTGTMTIRIQILEREAP